jgi:hypothetical protein
MKGLPMPFDTAIVSLVRIFRSAPHDSFHEKELHSVFFSLARQFFQNAQTTDGFQVSLLRQEFETIWLYQKKNTTSPFSFRYPEQGQGVRATTGCFDFALLQKTFVEQHDLITVINKHEPSRRHLRPPPGQLWANNQCSVALDSAVEFKMAHRRPQLDISQAQINDLQDGMVLDCRKLGRERVPAAYVLGFSHGPRPNRQDASIILRACNNEFASSCDGPNGRCSLRVVLATPAETFLPANWQDPGTVPGAIVLPI